LAVSALILTVSPDAEQADVEGLLALLAREQDSFGHDVILCWRQAARSNARSSKMLSRTRKT
jgi:hypothetical protein